MLDAPIRNVSWSLASPDYMSLTVRITSIEQTPMSQLASSESSKSSTGMLGIHPKALSRVAAG